MFSKNFKVLLFFLQNMRKAGSKMAYKGMGHTELESFLSIPRT